METQTAQSTRWGGALTAWPAKEALTRIGVPRVRMVIDVAMWLGIGAWFLLEAYATKVFDGVAVVVPPLALLAVVGAAELYDRLTLRHRLLPSVGVLVSVALLAVSAYAVDAQTSGAILLVVCVVQAMVRLPLAVGVPMGAVFVTCMSRLGDVSLREQLVVSFGVLVTGYMLRLDAQARGSGFLLLAQERVARAAEAETAALAERARIAREMHDVLAHSLSAQVVHLEAARLLVEREPEGPFRDSVLERVVAARRMAREGLAETRQALSALRGDMAPVEDYLREMAALDRADVQVIGPRRELTADASQALRRVAQEALTNVRKHAPGAVPRILLEYGSREVALEIRDSGRRDGREPGGSARPLGAARRADDPGLRKTDARRELAATGGGYGLLGMRERAELLGGTLEAGPEGEGFVVRLRMPV
ncbi:two-component sensor histidine kinase [Streptomyces spiroverticillatus]|uniref:histidine kinase n=1 Tax=Streptomyces finlayi TaxID=67296 RepID=A0A918WVW9_9ACTN|nr:histidine kinase [Streptomyces finlayi]GHA04142.1 two-component sensor histidine kinase [Streptomyces spiroverticillatus]GHC88243.1 two-component sensor histidine kinase [Streptomyces finlayi]